MNKTLASQIKSTKRSNDGLRGKFRQHNDKRIANKLAKHNTSSITQNFEIITVNGIDYRKTVTQSGVKPYKCAGCGLSIAQGEMSITLIKSDAEYENIEHRHCHNNRKCEQSTAFSLK